MPTDLQKPVIIIDGITFQLQARYKGGISRIWKNIIPFLHKSMPDCRFLLLVRDGNDPQIPGIQTIPVPRYSFASYRLMDQDAELISDICHTEGAHIFMSTYYSRASGIFSVQMVYDMIPEVFDANQELGMWLSKREAFTIADSFMAISRWTRSDLKRFYPQVAEDDVTIAYPGVSPELHPAPEPEISSFRQKYKIDKPYFLMVGSRRSYKNGAAAIQAFGASPMASQMMLVLAGGEVPDDNEKQAAGASLKHLGQIPDDDLRAAFSGAQALMYPSIYEGFGMPVTEALACGCPVITCKTSSIPEASGGYCLYARPDSMEEFRLAIERIMDPTIRIKLVESGHHFAQKFTWSAMAESVKSHLTMLLSGRAKSLKPSVERRIQIITADKQASTIKTAGNSADAIRLYTEMQQIDQLSSLPHYRLALMLEEKVDFTVASFECEKALSLDKFNKPVLLAYHRILGKLGQIEKSIAALQRYLDRNPGDQEILLAMKIAEEDQCKNLLSASQVVDTNYQKKPYRITALVSSYAAEEFINVCLSDLENQTIADTVEIIVIDANSPQQEGTIVKQFQEKYSNIRYVRTPERIGVYQAWNLAIYLSTSAYITPFSTNDRLKKDSYEILAQYLDNNPGISLVYGDSYLTELPKQSIDSFVPSKLGGAQCWPDFDYQALHVNCMVGPHPLWRRKVHDDLGYFDPRYLAVGDQDFWLRMGRKYALAHIKQFTGLIYLKQDSLSLKPNAMCETVDIHINYLEHYLYEQNAEMTLEVLGILLDQFLEAIISLVEAGENRNAAEFFDRHRKMFPTSPELVQIDTLIAKMKAKLKV